MDDPHEDLDASLQDFETPLSNPSSFVFSPSMRHHQQTTSTATTATTATMTPTPAGQVQRPTGARPTHRHQSRPFQHPQTEPESEMEETEPEEEEDVSAGGYSPPAWRRLGNGGRSEGFWRQASPLADVSSSPDPSLDYDTQHGADILLRAARTRLPRGSLSPQKEESPVPEADPDETVKVNGEHGQSTDVVATTISPPDNYIRFAVRAEVLQRTEALESLINFARNTYRRIASSWTSLTLSVLVALFSISTVKNLTQTPAQRPAGDLVKVAGIARSFEPLIYYSENAVVQVRDLQATSIAVWDLGESVRSSGIQDSASIVDGLNELSDSMKLLAIEMTRFFATVDGDIDGIINVMDWGKKHLARLNSTRSQSTISAAYDNFHNLLSSAYILEDSSGSPTPLGSLTTYVFGLSNPQREQRLVQLVFSEFLSVLESSITTELTHSMTIFALFEAIDRHFLNVANNVVREEGVQDDKLQELDLSSLWTRLLGGGGTGGASWWSIGGGGGGGGMQMQRRKYETNRQLLRDVRKKTVTNKESLLRHNAKLLTLQTALEGLRNKLVSPLVRGGNSSTLTLDDQIHSLSDVCDYLLQVRSTQKSKVMETLFGYDGAPLSQTWMLDNGKAD